MTRNSYTDRTKASENVASRRSGGEHSTYSKNKFKEDKSEGGGKIPGQPVKTHRIVINLDDKNRFTDEVTV